MLFFFLKAETAVYIISFAELFYKTAVLKNWRKVPGVNTVALLKKSTTAGVFLRIFSNVSEQQLRC